MEIRKVKHVFDRKATVEGAGVRLHRAFGFNQLPRFDPFLMLDDFRSDQPQDFQAGFPWHPHRGMETITYVLEGQVTHEDSLGNRGSLQGGDVQWMTAGSGIIHQEMPSGTSAGVLQGFQLWSNLPARYKLMDPRYQNIAGASIPQVSMAEGAQARLIAGKVGSVRGPVEDILTEPEFLDLTLSPSATLEHEVPKGRTVFAYVLRGKVAFAQQPAMYDNGQVILFGTGDRIFAKAGPAGAQFLLISGKPLAEPISWRGPMVMNTHEEIAAAFDELDRGTFIKVGKNQKM